MSWDYIIFPSSTQVRFRQCVFDISRGGVTAIIMQNPTYFHKLYTAAFGHTPTENHMRYRIRAAWAKLRDDNMTIAEIARMYGFASQSHFCRKFKQYSAQTPSQFRKSLRKQRAGSAADKT